MLNEPCICLMNLVYTLYIIRFSIRGYYYIIIIYYYNNNLNRTERFIYSRNVFTFDNYSQRRIIIGDEKNENHNKRIE